VVVVGVAVGVVVVVGVGVVVAVGVVVGVLVGVGVGVGVVVNLVGRICMTGPGGLTTKNSREALQSRGLVGWTHRPGSVTSGCRRGAGYNGSRSAIRRTASWTAAPAGGNHRGA
jgi:hypothetical protein